MNPLTCGVWVAVSVLAGFTVRLVVQRIMAANRELATLNSVKEFVDAMNREVYAGARELEAPPLERRKHALVVPRLA